jgi:hypothetical protein
MPTSIGGVERQRLTASPMAWLTYQNRRRCLGLTFHEVGGILKSRGARSKDRGRPFRCSSWPTPVQGGAGIEVAAVWRRRRHCR